MQEGRTPFGDQPAFLQRISTLWLGEAILLVVKTPYQHNDLSDRGPDHVKTTIRSIVDKFLDDDTLAGTVDPEKLQKGGPSQVVTSGVALER